METTTVLNHIPDLTPEPAMSAASDPSPTVWHLPPSASPAGHRPLVDRRGRIIAAPADKVFGTPERSLAGLLRLSA